MNDKQVSRRTATVLTALILCALAAFGLLWLSAGRHAILDTQTVTAEQAVQVCPSARITQAEFDLAARLLADERVTALFPDPGETDPPYHDLPLDLVDAAALELDGESVRVQAVTLLGSMLSVDYANETQGDERPTRRCILSISPDGTVVKSSARYRGQQMDLVYVVENFGNERFTLGREHRDLLYFLHD